MKVRKENKLEQTEGKILNERIVKDELTNKVYNKSYVIEALNSKGELEKKLYLEGIFTEFQDPDDPNDLNENGRKYTFEGKYPFKPHYEKLKFLIDNGYIVCGTNEHPDEDFTNLNTASFLIDRYEYIPEKNHIWGRIQVLDTEHGKNLRALIESGRRIFISSRAVGEIKEGGLVDIKQLITYDIVSQPGMKNAEMFLVNESKVSDIIKMELEQRRLWVENYNNITEDIAEPSVPAVSDTTVDSKEINISNTNPTVMSAYDTPITPKKETMANTLTIVLDEKSKLFTLAQMLYNYNPHIVDYVLYVEYNGVALEFSYDRQDIIIIDSSTDQDYPTIVSVNGKSINEFADIVKNNEEIESLSEVKIGDEIFFTENEDNSLFNRRKSKIYLSKLTSSEQSNIRAYDTYKVTSKFSNEGIEWVELLDEKGMRNNIPVNWKRYTLNENQIFLKESNNIGLSIVIDNDEKHEKHITEIKSLIANNMNEFKGFSNINETTFFIEDGEDIYKYNIIRENITDKSYDFNIKITNGSGDVLYDVKYNILNESSLFELIDILD